MDSVVLFEEDFYRLGASVHVDTMNSTFIKQHHIYKKMGIENNKFFLALFDKDLSGYDPHNLNDSSVELRQRIAFECHINPWYYFREVIRLPYVGVEGTPFLANRANIAVIWLFYMGIDSIIVIPRQKGKTVGALAITSHIQNIALMNASILALAQDSDLIQSNISRLKYIKDNLPDYLVDKKAFDDNKEGLTYSALKNRYITMISPMDKNRASKVGRGQTAPVIHIDEAAFCANIDKLYQPLITASDTAIKQAKESGLPYGTMITTTAGDLTIREAQFCYNQFVQKSMLYVDQVLDLKDRENVKKYIRDNSLNDMVYVCFSYKQLGETDEWFEDQCRRKGGDKDQIARDFLNIWTTGGIGGVLTEHERTLIGGTDQDPIFVTETNGLTFRWYIEKEKYNSPSYRNKNIIISMDSADGVGEDFTTLTFVDPEDLGVIATCRSNTKEPIEVGRVVAEVLIEWPNAIFIPERKSSGAYIIDVVIEKLIAKGMSPIKRIFNGYYQDGDAKSIRNLNKESTYYGSGRKKYGFMTNSDNRRILYSDVLKTVIKLAHHLIKDSVIIREMLSLINKNGRVDHPADGHDDQLISYLIACFFVLYGKNIEQYGLDRSILLNKVMINDKKDVDETYKAIQKDLAERYKTLQLKLNKTDDPNLQIMYKKEIIQIKNNIDPDFMKQTELTLGHVEESSREQRPNLSNIMSLLGG